MKKLISVIAIVSVTLVVIAAGCQQEHIEPQSELQLKSVEGSLQPNYRCKLTFNEVSDPENSSFIGVHIVSGASNGRDGYDMMYTTPSSGIALWVNHYGWFFYDHLRDYIPGYPQPWWVISFVPDFVGSVKITMSDSYLPQGKTWRLHDLKTTQVWEMPYAFSEVTLSCAPWDIERRFRLDIIDLPPTK